MRLHARVMGVVLIVANAILVPLLYLTTKPHFLDWPNIGVGIAGLALLVLSFVWRRHG